MLQALPGATRDVADVFFVLVRRNNRRGLRSNIFCHVERSREIPLRKLKKLPRGSSTSLRFARNDNDCKRTRSGSHELSSSDNGMEISRVIRAANQRPRSDVAKTLRACDVPVIIQLLGCDVFDDGQMLRTRTKILAHG